MVFFLHNLSAEEVSIKNGYGWKPLILFGNSEDKMIGDNNIVLHHLACSNFFAVFAVLYLLQLTGWISLG